MNKNSWIAALLLMFTSVAAGAADVQGSGDYPLIKRYEGSEIIGYKSIAFDEYTLPLSVDMGEIQGGKKQVLQGSIKRIVYRVPIGHTSFEIYNNYVQALTEANFQTLAQAEFDPGNASDFANFICMEGNTQDSACGEMSYYNAQKGHYLAAKLVNTADGKDIYVALEVTEKAQDQSWNAPWRNPDMPAAQPVQLNHGEVVVLLDVIETKAMQNKMVFVKSSEMADAINKTGKIDIYGITFDIDKTDIKPESVPTLAEVAKLLTENPTLKLEISGHTDNTGSPEHNQTLSEGRAVSVVNALVSQYHIDASRLVAKGYGDTKPIADNSTEEGRAKNRRVELSKLQ